MEQDYVLEALLAYGADPEVLEEYDCVPVKARVVHDLVKVRTASGSRAFKKVYVSVPRLDYVFRCTEFIAGQQNQRLSYVPRFIRTRYGDPYVNHTSGLYYMTSWRSGREADLRKEAEFVATAQVLARWHEATEGCPHTHPGHPADMAVRIQESLQTIQSHQVTVRDAGAPSPFERLFLSCSDELLARGHDVVEQLQRAGLKDVEAAARRRGLLCHGNLSRQNVIYDGSTFALLHYDHVQLGSPLTDLALYIHRYLPSYEWDPEVLGRVVSAYRETWQDAAFDEDVLYALLGAPLRSLQVVTWYFQRAKDWDEEDYIDYLETALELEEAREAAREIISQGGNPPPRSLPPLHHENTAPVAGQVDAHETQDLRPALVGETRVLDNVAVGDIEPGEDVPVHMVEAVEVRGERATSPTRAARQTVRKARAPANGVRASRKSRLTGKEGSGPTTQGKGPRLWGDVFASKDDL